MTRRNNHQRDGAVLVASLVCLLIVMSMLGSMLQGTLRVRRQLHAERDRRQAELLLQAGADRAAVRLAKDSQYRGETWFVPADNIVGTGDGQVTIATSRSSESEPWQVRVVAEYPLGSHWSVRRSREFTVSKPNPQT